MTLQQCQVHVWFSPGRVTVWAQVRVHFPLLQAVLQHMEPDLKFAAQAAAEFISICWEHGLNQMVLDDLLLTSDDEARAHEIPLQWDEDEMMMATNFRTGFLLH